jgi:hypothetical protein
MTKKNSGARCAAAILAEFVCDYAPMLSMVGGILVIFNL